MSNLDALMNWRCPKCKGVASQSEAGVGARAPVCTCEERERDQPEPGLTERDFELDEAYDSDAAVAKRHAIHRAKERK